MIAQGRRTRFSGDPIGNLARCRSRPGRASELPTRIGTYAGDPVKYLRDMPVIEVVGADVPVTAVGDHQDLGCGCQSGFVVGLQVRT